MNGPIMEQLIDLAENGDDTTYYGALLGEVLGKTGTVANDNGDGTISLYEVGSDTNHDAKSRAWRKRSVWASSLPIPGDVLPKIRPENRGEDFPAGVPFTPSA